jgi:tetratricopeptide (TPR) repeat protein
MLLGDLDNGNLNNLLSGRLDGWRAGQLMFRERPLVGVGPGAFAAEFTSAKLELLERGVVFFREHRGLSTFANAHSEPIEVAAELGALGLLALAWLVVVTARQLWRAKLDPGDRRLVIAALAAFAVLALTWFPSRVAMIAYPNALVLAWLFRREPAPPQDPSSITARARETGGGQRWLGPTLVAALAIALVLECARARSLLLASHILGRSEALAEAMLASGTIDRQYLAAASKRLEHAATLAPGDARIPLALGSHYYLLGNGPEAVRWYRRALEVEPRPEIYLNLGRSLWVGGQREEGGELMRIAALLEPSLQAAIPLEARAP